MLVVYIVLPGVFLLPLLHYPLYSFSPLALVQVNVRALAYSPHAFAKIPVSIQ